MNFLNQLGAGAVALFFMTTGLVFYPLILRGFKATSWRTVLISRAFRILPLVVTSVAIVTLVIVCRTDVWPDLSYFRASTKWIFGWNEPSLLGYSDSGRINAYVLWSLWYEWLFYLFVLPVIAAGMDLVKGRDLPSFTVPTVLLIVSLVGNACVTWMRLPGHGIRYLPLFAIGMIAFELQSRPMIRAALSRPVVSLLAVGMLLSGMLTTQYPYGRSLPLFSFFFVCVACGNDLWGMLRMRGALILGECSFGIYLLHGIALSVIFVDLGVAQTAISTIAIPALLPVIAFTMVLITAVTYLAIERPSIRIGRLVSKRLRGCQGQLTRHEVEIAP